VVANTLEDRKDLTSFMARDLLGIDFEEKHIPLREYDLSMLLKPFDFATDPEDGIMGVTVKELRFMEVGERNERITLESMSGADRSIWEMAERRIGLEYWWHRTCAAGRDRSAGMGHHARTVHDQVPPGRKRRSGEIADAYRHNAAWL